MCTEIMRSIGNGNSVAIPIPETWIKSLKSDGIRVNEFGCKIKLYKYALYSIAKGFAKLGLFLIQKELPENSKQPYSVFLDLAPNNLPDPNQRDSFDLITWYRQSKIISSKNAMVWAQIREDSFKRELPHTKIVRNIFPIFNKYSQFIHFFTKSILSLLIVVWGIIRGKWWYGLLYDESVRFHYVQALDRSQLGNEYYFSNSSWFYKPLWTFEAEKRGSSTILYYYATNIEKIAFAGHTLSDTYGLKIMQWNRIVVWDEQQRDYLHQYCPDAEYQIVGSIDYLDSGKRINDLEKGFKIAVFDVTPTRPVIYSSMGCALPPYYSRELYFNFMHDISALSTEKKVTLLWKKKRAKSVGKMDAKISRRFDEELKNNSIITIDPDISARRLIAQCDAGISMPFTSTSIIGKELGKPSIFYDASSSIDKDISHGIPVIKSKDALFDWINNIEI